MVRMPERGGEVCELGMCAQNIILLVGEGEEGSANARPHHLG